MKLERIDADTVRRAVRIYLDHAYPGESRERAPSVSLEGGETARDLLDRFADESQLSGERAIHRYVLRLGNDRYPHMKLVLEEYILHDQFVFGVDTHDNVRVSPDSPDYARWNALRSHNREVAVEIEKAWRAESVPTLADLKHLLDSVETLPESLGRSVLIVDDDPSIRDTIRLLLERAGLTVRTACEGQEALDAVATERPHLILMDFEMPGMDGVSCCERLKADPATRGIPVLLATRAEVDLSTLAFADGFLVKPYHRDVLFSLVRKLLS